MTEARRGADVPGHQATGVATSIVGTSCRSRDVTPRFSEHGKYASPFDNGPPLAHPPLPTSQPGPSGQQAPSGSATSYNPGAALHVEPLRGRPPAPAHLGLAPFAAPRLPRGRLVDTCKLLGLVCAALLCLLLVVPQVTDLYRYGTIRTAARRPALYMTAPIAVRRSGLAASKRRALVVLPAVRKAVGAVSSMPPLAVAPAGRTPPEVAASNATSAPAVGPSGLPADFDWVAYLRLNRDLERLNVTDKAAAEAHYLKHGAGERRLYKNVHITLRYTACGGLFNQQYSHLAALALAVLAGAQEVVWPPMQERASFARHFHPDPALNNQTWTYLDAAAVWDVNNIALRLLESYGLTVTKHPSACGMPDLSRPDTAFQVCPPPGPPGARVRLDVPVYLKHHDPGRLVDALHVALRGGFDRASRHPDRVLVDLPCTLFMLDVRGVAVVEGVAKALAWSPTIVAMADQVVQRIDEQGKVAGFNGVHLRMERDAVDWMQIVGGRSVYWNKYKGVMRRVGMPTPPLPLYVASGLLKASGEDAWSRDEMARLTRELINQKFTTSVVYKELYLTAADLAGLSNEQSALVDYLVLLRACKFVGIGLSTFSFYLREARLMGGAPPADTDLLMLPRIGTDELFYTAAVAATRTRARPGSVGGLGDRCKRVDGKPCFSQQQPVARAY